MCCLCMARSWHLAGPAILIRLQPVKANKPVVTTCRVSAALSQCMRKCVGCAFWCRAAGRGAMLVVTGQRSHCVECALGTYCGSLAMVPFAILAHVVCRKMS